jgi:hypothetical protein
VLAHNGFWGHEVLSRLTSAWEKGATPELTVLDLRGTALFGQGHRTLWTFLTTEHLPRLSELILSDTHSDVLGDMTPRVLTSKSRLRKLHVRGNVAFWTHVSLRALFTSRTLVELDVTRLRLCGTLVAEALSGCPRDLILPHLQILRMSDNAEFGSVGAEALFPALTKLRVLEAARCLIHSRRALSSLGALQELDISRNGLGPEAIPPGVTSHLRIFRAACNPWLAVHLLVFDSVQTLDLHKVSMGDHMFQALVSLLPPSLVTLSVAQNDIGQVAFDVFARKICTCALPALSDLNIAHNKLTCASKLVYALCHGCSHLERFNVSGNPTEPDALSVLWEKGVDVVGNVVGSAYSPR